MTGDPVLGRKSALMEFAARDPVDDRVTGTETPAYALQDLQGETEPAGTVSAVFIGSPIPVRRQEFGEDAAVAGMNLDGVKAGLPGSDRRVCKKAC